MRLTWRDAATLPFMAAIIGIYVAHQYGANGWIVSSTRETGAAIFVLGMFGGCALSGASEVFQTDRTRAVQRYAALASCLGFTALAAGIAVMLSGEGAALAVLFAAIMALWVLSTLRHAFTEPRQRGGMMPPPTFPVSRLPRTG